MQLSLNIHNSDIENCNKKKIKKKEKKRKKKYYYDNTFCLLSFYMINVEKFSRALFLFFYFNNWKGTNYFTARGSSRNISPKLHDNSRTMIL